MIPLDTIQIASPCHANWNEMKGDAQVRFCTDCRKNVYNLSEMTRDEAQMLVNRMEGRLCIRFYTRADGTMLTQDCPVGLRAVRRRLVKKLSFAAVLLLSCATSLLRLAGMAQAVTVAKKHIVAIKPQGVKPHVPVQHLMGKLIPPGQLTGKPGLLPLAHPFGSTEDAYLGGMHAPTMGAPPVPASKP